MDETNSRDFLIQKIDALLLKLTDFEESLLITADGDSLYVTGSEKGKNFLKDNQHIAEEFHKYCYDSPVKSSNCTSLWKQKISFGKEPSGKFPVYVKPAFTVYNLNNDEEEHQTEISNIRFQQKRSSSFRVFDIADQSYSSNSWIRRPNADSLIGPKVKPNVKQDIPKNFEVKVCKGSKSTQIKVSPIKVKSGQSLKKGINLDVTKKYNHADSKSSKKPGDDEPDITIIEHSDEDMAEGKKKGSPVWSPKIVLRKSRVSRARMDSTKPEKKVTATSKAVCEVKDSDTDELIKVGSKYNMDSEDTSKHSDDVEKESDQSKEEAKGTSMAGPLAGDDSDLDQDIPEPMESDDVELSDYSFLGENEDDPHLVQGTSVSDIKLRKSKQPDEEKSFTRSDKKVVNDTQPDKGPSNTENHGSKKRKNTTPLMRSPQKKIKVEMIDETEQSPAELAVQCDGECGSKPMAEMEYPDPLYDTEESMETSKKESSNITSPDMSSSISSAKEASKRISEDLHVGSLPKSKQQEEVARKDVKNSPKTKSPKIPCKLNDVEGTQKKYLVVSLEKIPDTDIQQPGKSVMKTNYQIHKNTPEVTSMSSADLIKSSEEGIEESVQLTEENMDKFTEEFKTAASQNAHNNNLSSISEQPNIEKVETTSSEFEKDSVPKSKRQILEPKKPRTETSDSHCTESKPLAVTNMETCSSVSEKSEQEKTSKPLSNIQGKGNNTAKAGTGKKVIDFKNFSLDLRALAVQMAKKKQKKN
ncbi:titin homolog isoform X2 [Crassostrea angulata]|uniref:titin homolog isoform X2 n=1 Tax=Magallana angulata TaxID=2784310 RepID=UPI0022B118B2|nr:titin homolog isoform X2 [Crassostrea angulata]